VQELTKISPIQQGRLKGRVPVMILFINVFITNQRFEPLTALPEDRKHDKLEIFKFMLSSYSVIPWSKVYIYYELDENFMNRRDETDEFIHQLFPKKLVLKNFRIDNYLHWKKALRELNQEQDEWIWLSCNDDHVFIDSDLNCLDRVLAFAAEKSEFYKYIAILPSHWQEFMALKERNRVTKKIGSPLIDTPFGEGDTLEDNDFCSVTTHRTTISIQIVNRNLLNYWFSEPQLLPSDLRRTDRILNMPKDQISIIPYRELARHFDGYTHSKVSLEVVPVMMIPDKFFEKKVKIQYGFEQRKAGFVWMHPLKEMIQNEVVHSERGSTNDKCDTNILLEDTPLFWREKIEYIEREDLDPKQLREAYLEQKLKEICGDPRFGFRPLKGAITHERQIFRAKYSDLTRAELRHVAYKIWGLRDYIFRIKIFFYFLRTSRVKFFKSIWVMYAVFLIIKNPRLFIKSVLTLLKNPRKVLTLSSLKVRGFLVGATYEAIDG
jgi:hypothetical protein